jgi:hypothetical protein
LKADDYYDETDYLTAVNDFAQKYGEKKPGLTPIPNDGWVVSVKRGEREYSAKGKSPKEACKALCLKLKITPKAVA